MSLLEYIKNKSRPQISIKMNAYREAVQADLASLVLKPNEKINEAKKHIVNLREISKILKELNYPLIDEFGMAIRTGDPKKVNRTHMAFRRWAEYQKPEKTLSDRIETIMFQYESNLFNDFGPEQADEILASATEESKAILENLAQRIDMTISTLRRWGNYPVTIEAVGEKDWIVSDVKVTIGEAYPVSFLLHLTPLGLKAGELQKAESVPDSLSNDALELLNKLSTNPKYNKIITLYMTRPITDRRFFELSKRDLSLGIQAVLPGHVILTTEPQGDQDVWKVKIDEKYIFERQSQGNIKEYSIIGEEAPIKWIEQFRKAEIEK